MIAIYSSFYFYFTSAIKFSTTKKYKSTSEIDLNCLLYWLLFYKLFSHRIMIITVPELPTLLIHHQNRNETNRIESNQMEWNDAIKKF